MIDNRDPIPPHQPQARACLRTHACSLSVGDSACQSSSLIASHTSTGTRGIGGLLSYTEPDRARRAERETSHHSSYHNAIPPSPLAAIHVNGTTCLSRSLSAPLPFPSLSAHSCTLSPLSTGQWCPEYTLPPPCPPPSPLSPFRSPFQTTFRLRINNTALALQRAIACCTLEIMSVPHIRCPFTPPTPPLSSPCFIISSVAQLR